MFAPDVHVQVRHLLYVAAGVRVQVGHSGYFAADVQLQVRHYCISELMSTPKLDIREFCS